MRRPGAYTLAALALALAAYAALELTKTTVPLPQDAQQLDAAVRMARAEVALGEALAARGIPVEAELDLNRTGLIGPEWTPLTTTVGDLEAKRTILNPNFAAMMVRLYREAGLKSGDVVAIGASGSFPGLIVASICAADALGLRPVTIASFGASMYGGTRPEFSSPEMLRILEEKGLVSRSLAAVSPGANQDSGESPLFGESKALIAGLAKRTGLEFIAFDPPDLKASIARRLAVYGAAAGKAGPSCFVNIGGASANYGESPDSLQLPPGLVLRPAKIPASSDRGLMYEYAARGLPVINLLNVKYLSRKYGLPWDPLPLPKPGSGGIYSLEVRSKPIAAAALGLGLGLMTAAGLARRRRLAQERAGTEKVPPTSARPGRRA